MSGAGDDDGGRHNTTPAPSPAPRGSANPDGGSVGDAGPFPEPSDTAGAHTEPVGSEKGHREAVGAEGGRPARAFLKGLTSAPLTPGVILFAAMIGFGALARDAGFSAGQAVFLTVTIYQLPGQVALVDQLGRGAALSAAAFAVVLTAVRLFPMTVVLMPYLRGSRLPRWLAYAGAHFIAITVWVESLQRLPRLPPAERLPYYLGFGCMLLTSTAVATLMGYHLSGAVPELMRAALLFLTPIYFILSMVATAQGHGDRWAIVLGGALGPLLFLALPGPDLLLTGLVAGTGAYLIGRMANSPVAKGDGDKETHA